MQASPFPKPSDRRNRERTHRTYVRASICQEARPRHERDRLIAFFPAMSCYDTSSCIPGLARCRLRNRKQETRSIRSWPGGRRCRSRGIGHYRPLMHVSLPLAIASSTPFPIHPYQAPQRGPWHIRSSPHAPGSSIKEPPSSLSVEQPCIPASSPKENQEFLLSAPPLPCSAHQSIPTPLTLPSASRTRAGCTHPHRACPRPTTRQKRTIARR